MEQNLNNLLLYYLDIYIYIYIFLIIKQFGDE